MRRIERWAGFARAGSIAVCLPVLTVWLLFVGTGAAEPSLALGLAGAALLCAWGLARHVAGALPALAGIGPVVAARARERSLADAVPRQRDPDAAGHTRSRAPSVGTRGGLAY